MKNREQHIAALYFCLETGGGERTRSDKKIKSACSRTLGMVDSITREVISPGGPT